MKSIRTALLFGLSIAVFSAHAQAFCIPFPADLCSFSCSGEIERITPELVQSSSPGTKVCALAAAANEQTLDALLKSGVDINTRTVYASRNTPSKRNALFRVVNSNDMDLLKILLANHIDVNVQDSRGESPLMIAAWGGGHDEIVEVLLKAGALPNLKDKRGETALCYAQRFTFSSNEKTIDALKAAGAVCE